MKLILPYSIDDIKLFKIAMSLQIKSAEACPGTIQWLDLQIPEFYLPNKLDLGKYGLWF